MSNPHTSFEFVSRAKLPTKFGQFTIHGFVDTSNNQEHIALSHGEWSANEIVPIRIHSECLTGDALFSTKCDCGFQLERALQNIVANGAGALLYLRQEGRGIGLLNKIKAYSLQDEGMDTVEANEHLGFDADMRDYSICKTILDTLEIQRVELMTNNPKKLNALIALGIDVVSCQAIDHGVTDANRDYLKTKADKLGHTFSTERLK